MSRAQRLRDLLSAICEWQRASGFDRLCARRNAAAAIREFRHFHLDPERAAFTAAVAAAQYRREAA